MTKADLIDKMAKDAKISKVAAGAVLDSFMANVTKALKKKNGKVTLVGFGTFQKVRQKAGSARFAVFPLVESFSKTALIKGDIVIKIS